MRGHLKLPPGRLVLGLLLATAALASVRPALAADRAERQSRVQQELERTEEQIRFVAERAKGADVPRVAQLLRSAREIQERARQTFARVQPDMSLAAADTYFRQTLTLTLKARDLAHRAARDLREDLSQQENARRLLDRVQQRLEQLRDGRGLDNERVAQAAELIDRARLQWRDGRFEQALRLAQNAQALLDALGDEGRGAGARERFQRQVERTRQMLERARERAGDDERARRALTQAQTHLRQAVQAAEEGRSRAAIRRLEEAQRLLERILGADRGDAGLDAERVRIALERLDANLQRVRDRVGSDAPREVERLLTKAQDERDRASRALRDGDLEGAVRHVRVATDLLARLQRRGRGN